MILSLDTFRYPQVTEPEELGPLLNQTWPKKGKCLRRQASDILNYYFVVDNHAMSCLPKFMSGLHLID